MKTFAKFTSLFVLAIVLFLNAPVAKATSHSDEKIMEMHVVGSDRTNIGSTVTAQLYTHFYGNGILTVENVAGQRFVETHLKISYGKNVVKLNVSDIPAGVYFIKVSGNGQTETTSFVVSHLNS